LYLSQRPSGAVLSGNPHHCALALPHTHTHTWAPAVLPSGDAMCELKGLMQKRFNPRKNLYFLYYSISVVVMSSIALLNAVVWMTNQHRLRFPASLQSFSE